MAASEERSISEFPSAVAILATTLLFVSTVNGNTYDSEKTTAAELATAILGDFEYTTDLFTNVKTIFGAINSIMCLYGNTIPSALQGTDGQFYVKYTSSGGTDTVDGLYWKINNAWVEISTGGGGGASVTLGTTVPSDASGSDGDLYVQYDGTSYAVIDYYVKINGSWRKSPYSRVVALTQAEYDLITPDNQTLYVITDKQGSYVKLPVITDAWNSATSYTVGSYCIHNDTLWKCTTANSNQEPVSGSTYWDDTSVADELALKANESDIEYHVGDTINISNLQLTGIITSGQKSIYIQLPLPKAIGSDVNTITLNANALFYIRHVSGGYILNNQTLTSIGTVTLKKNLSGIFIGVDMTNAFTGCPNNTPLVISTGEGANDYITFS